MTGWPAGYGLARFDEIDSTNDEARRMAAAGQRDPVWIVAVRQTAGRGRRGRAWDTGTGNLAATLLIRPDRPQNEWPQLSFAAALSVADTLCHFAPAAAVTVKWPNDVLAEGKKAAGILLESGGEQGGWLAVGIGINLAHFPDGTEFPATSLAALGAVPPAPEDALAHLAARFAHWYDGWMHTGFEGLRTAWLARAGGLGAQIRARLPHEERVGRFEGIDGQGALLLETGGRVQAIRCWAKSW